MGIKSDSDSTSAALAALRASRAKFGIAQDSDEQGVPEDFEMRQAVQKAVREAVVQAGSFIEQFVEDGHEKSLAFTHLEEALMWAGKGIFK